MQRSLVLNQAPLVTDVSDAEKTVGGRRGAKERKKQRQKMDWSDNESPDQTENIREKKIHNCSTRKLQGSSHMPLFTTEENMLQRRATI